MHVCHQLVDCRTLRSAARDGRNPGSVAGLFRFMYHHFDLHTQIRIGITT